MTLLTAMAMATGPSQMTLGSLQIRTSWALTWRVAPGGGTASLDEGERLQAIDPTDATDATLIDFTVPKTTNEAAPVGAYPFGTGSSLCVDLSLGNQILNSSLVFDADPTADSVG